jgi:hypothetical protein
MRETAVKPRLRPVAADQTARQRLLRIVRTVSSPFLRPRTFHAFGVGMAKSGTHSLSAMFRRHHRSAHEPEEDLLIEHILGVADGRVSSAVLERYLTEADKRLKLEMNASLLNYFVLPSLVEMFGEARFILTVRPPLVWLESMINQQLRIPCPVRWQRLRDLRFGNTATFSAEEHALEARGLYTLKGYLSYWARHNRDVLQQVPGDRLLVVETNRLASSIGRIAEFLGVPASTLNARDAHAFKARRHFDVLSEMDQGYLEETAIRICGVVIETCNTRIDSPPNTAEDWT